MSLIDILHKLADAGNFALDELNNIHAEIDALDKITAIPAEVAAATSETVPAETTPLNVSPAQ